MTLVVGIAAALLAAAGVAACVLGVVGVEEASVARQKTDWEGLLAQYGKAAGMAAVGVAVWLVTGWPVAGLAAAAGGWLVPRTIAQSRQQKRDHAMLDATRMWLLQLRTILQAGTGLEKALRETASSARPDSPITPPLRRMADRLGWMAPADALERFAAEVDNHVADTAIAVLTSAMTRSSKGVAPALVGLSKWAEEDLRTLREVETSYKTLHLTRRIILAVFGFMAAWLAVTSPDLVAPYGTLLGQIVLLAIGGLAGLALWLMIRWSTLAKPERFYRQGPA